MKAAFLTLGCKVNQYETQAMAAFLEEKGHTVVPFGPGADVYIINTCSVTSTGDKKSRNAIRRAQKMAPDALIAVCGCYSQLNSGDVEKMGVALVGGSSDRRQFIEKLLRVYETRVPDIAVDEPMKRKVMELLPPGGAQGRTRAMLKVEDGCTNFCTYCVIPYSRGPVRSLPMVEAVAQAKQLQAEGYREIVITGIEIASYGRDLPGKPSPTALFAAVCDAVPHVRIRLGSLEPRVVDEEFCQTLSEKKNLCPQFHLSMQSGCDETLRRMGRKYDTERFYTSVRLLREHFPGCAVTTDMITGFPGETEEEFASTLSFIRKCGFSAMHIFPYSQRQGTRAAAMADKVPIKEREARAGRAIAVAKEMQQAYLTGQVGKTLSVLYETEEEGFSQGHAMNYTLVRCEGAFHGQVIQTRITEAKDGVLYGTAAEPTKER